MGGDHKVAIEMEEFKSSAEANGGRLFSASQYKSMNERYDSSQGAFDDQSGN